MIRVTLIALALLTSGALVASAAKEQIVFLPEDCEVLTVVGAGFQLNLTQFDSIKRDFEVVAEESAKVETPHEEQRADNEESSKLVGDRQQPAEKEADRPAVNGEESGLEGNVAVVDEVDDDLLGWIDRRATALVDRIARYETELVNAQAGNRIVLDILLLNTLSDLETLNKEQILPLAWIKRKLDRLLANNIHKEIRLSEVFSYVNGQIRDNLNIEKRVRGTNKPGKEWQRNTQAIKRVLHEQRFSRELSELITGFLTGNFNLMKRSDVYKFNMQAKQLDDNLYYEAAKGRVPADFPFSAQDSIVRGASI